MTKEELRERKKLMATLVTKIQAATLNAIASLEPEEKVLVSERPEVRNLLDLKIVIPAE